MNAIRSLHYIVTVLFFLCYAYQFLYIPVSWFKKPKTLPKGRGTHRFAFLVCARNEAAVIGDLLDSIHAQTYDPELLTVFVMADNCTDDTAQVARAHGARVYTRRDSLHVGKGYALEALRSRIRRDYPEGFDGYFVFDADNLLTPTYVAEMDRVFSAGYDIVTSYRNSKNYGDNWISAGYGLWFLRESRYLHYPRFLLGTSCNVSGTGFLFSRSISQEIGNWPYHTLTEDIEFSADQILKGRQIAFCREAEFFDEQPTSFVQSWHQRLRWSKGYLQVFGKHGTQLTRAAVQGSFAAFDMTMNIMPAFILSTLSLVLDLILGFRGAMLGASLLPALVSLGELFGNLYLTLFVMGALTTLTEWRAIREKPLCKLAYTLTFPLFMLTFLPISLAALFWKGGWTPIRHSATAKRLETGRQKL